ncbi:lytic transglycosylase domain-containing protein [Frigidibacter oleivorans]|uniref:lytic transglycosylase domain-containing protein n=1 Tax=Frigidibacter oleivorans TaxID=2487129 RepID=UPI001F2A8E68|nr:lytic transglycosylase domain-containing protein [Frigidibacter oleivorans]
MVHGFRGVAAGGAVLGLLMAGGLLAQTQGAAAQQAAARDVVKAVVPSEKPDEALPASPVAPDPNPSALPQPAPAVPAPYPDFSAKRISVPKPGTAKRITVQIDPAEQARMLAAVMPPPEVPIPRGGDGGLAPPAVPGSYEWFWQTVSPSLGQAQGRFPQALAALAQGPGGSSVAAPRLQRLQEIATAHGRDILMATIGTQVSPALVLAVIGVESGGRPAAVSSAGAVGLMQLIPATADRFGVTDSADPVQNIRGGVAYLDWLMREFDRDPLMVLAGYNAGEGAVRANGGVPPYAETRDYVPKVLAAWQVARGLCLTPPELVSDGCVFRLPQG